MAKHWRFVGAWRLESFVTRASNGLESHPLGREPAGIIIWDESGAMSAQLGTGQAGAGPYIAYFGTIDVDDAPEGVLTHRVEGASSQRLLEDQVRRFRFVDADTLELCPPPDADGAQSTLRWRRIRGAGHAR